MVEVLEGLEDAMIVEWAEVAQLSHFYSYSSDLTIRFSSLTIVTDVHPNPEEHVVT